ncbi:MAG: hypothetical protein IPG17_00840 [Sandaracinaceae bacterium]|nr:hypothetical protein [Sandaracinaceae bacterium]
MSAMPVRNWKALWNSTSAPPASPEKTWMSSHSRMDPSCARAKRRRAR